MHLYYAIFSPNEVDDLKQIILDQGITHSVIEHWNQFFKRIEEIAGSRQQATRQQEVLAIRNLHEQSNYILTQILKALDFPKATNYYHINRLNKTDKDKDLKEEIRDIHQTHENYGYRRVHGELRRRGYTISKNKVQRLMQDMNLQVTSFTRKSRKYNSYRGLISERKRQIA